jgi:hypothetical protein
MAVFIFVSIHILKNIYSSVTYSVIALLDIMHFNWFNYRRNSFLSVCEGRGYEIWLIDSQIIFSNTLLDLFTSNVTMKMNISIHTLYASHFNIKQTIENMVVFKESIITWTLSSKHRIMGLCYICTI